MKGFTFNISLYLYVPGPVPAITEALKKVGLTLNDMDLVEVNVLKHEQML